MGPPWHAATDLGKCQKVDEKKVRVFHIITKKHNYLYKPSDRRVDVSL